MCGIVGYIGKNNASEVLIYGLKTLEYRGYDSAGISILMNNKIKITKSVGKIAELEKKINKDDISHLGIGHTRWATHGNVCEKNSHPHTSGNVTLVHNGIIENFKELKEKYNNVKYISDTDSEVAAAVINHYYTNDPIEAINKAAKELKGSYALLIIFKNHDKLYAIRKGSPLIAGISKDENFVASDISAILKYTNKYIDMDELEIYEISDKKVITYDKDKKVIHKKVQTAKWNLEDAQKNGYDHFMLKEIHEQVDIVNKIKSKFIDDNTINTIDLSKYNRIDIVGCGSAYHSALVGKNLYEKYNKNSKCYMTVDVASEYRYKNHFFNKKVLVIVISQSGETADTLAALRLAKENSVDTLAIVNVISSTIAKEAKYVMPLLAGPEIAVATTKGYFSQTLDLSLLILKMLQKQEIVVTKYLKELDKLSKEVKGLIDNQEYAIIAKEIYNCEHIYFIGRGIDYAISLEASLKLKEISYIHSDTYQAGELKHGPIALIEKDTPVFVTITEDELKDKTLSNAIEAKSRGARLILIKKENIEVDNKLFDFIISIPQKSNLFIALLVAIPYQLIAYNVAKNKNCDIDKPKNLAKSVTVE